MTRLKKVILYIVSVVIFLVAADLYVGLVFGMPAQLRGTMNLGRSPGLTVVASSLAHTTKVSIDGYLISSAHGVSGINQFRWGHRIVVIVREAPFPIGGRDKPLHVDVVVPDDVNEITFGNLHDVIWHR
jgi:hypothetical protein